MTNATSTKKVTNFNIQLLFEIKSNTKDARKKRVPTTIPNTGKITGTIRLKTNVIRLTL